MIGEAMDGGDGGGGDYDDGGGGGMMVVGVEISRGAWAYADEVVGVSVA